MSQAVIWLWYPHLEESTTCWLYPVHGHRTAIFDVEIVLNPWLEEIAKKEAPTKDQRLPGSICRAARHLRRNAAEPRRREIQPVNKGVNEPHRVVRTDIVIHCLRQKQQLRAVVTSDVRHAE